MNELRLREAYLCSHRQVVRHDWIDHNKHMNLTAYPVAFYEAVNEFSSYLGMTREFKTRTQTASFLADMHLSYKRELFEAAPIVIYSRIVNFDAKRVHAWHEMFHEKEGYLAAYCEMLSLNIDTKTRRVTERPDEVMTHLALIQKQHNTVPRPNDVSRSITI